MDAAGPASATAPLIFRRTSVLLLLTCCSILGTAPAQEQNTVATAQSLLAQGRWQELLQQAEQTPQPSPDVEYYRGLALAHFERWDDACAAFLAGQRMQPRDKRFPIELAGIAFKQKNYARSAVHLRAALRLNPEDSYANEFLATVYFLEGNLEAALEFWNRVGKPAIEQVRMPANLHVNPVLRDRAFAFSPASILRSEELLATDARLQ